jgi:hypothetical protein
LKGLVVDIDFTIGLTLFLFTAAGVLAVVQSQRPGPELGRSAQVADEIAGETSVTVFDRNLHMNSPSSVPRYPVDRRLAFEQTAFPESAFFESPAAVTPATGRLVSVPDFRNQSLRLRYYSANLSDPNYTNELDGRDGAYINNSRVRLEFGASGLDSLAYKRVSRNLLRSDAQIPGSDFSVDEKQLSASTLSGDLKLYNGSPEFIVEDGPVDIPLKDLPTLYIQENNRTISLGSGFSDTFETDVLAVAENDSSSQSGGLVFAGDLSAEVRDTSSGVNVNLSFPDRLRVRVVDGLDQAYRRSRAEQGYLVFGPADTFRALSGNRTLGLRSESSQVFRRRLGIGDANYNISLGRRGSVSEPSWTGNFNDTAVEASNLTLSTTDGDGSYNKSYSLDSPKKVVISNVDVPEGVDLEFELSAGGNTSTRSLSNGTQVFNVGSGPADSFEVEFSSRNEPRQGNWTIDAYTVFHGDYLNRGATLPPGSGVDTERRSVPFVDRNMSVYPANLEVRTW